jgi:integrase
LDGPGFGLNFEYLEDLSSVAVNEMIHRLRTRRGYTPKTLNRIREVLSRFCTWAQRFQGVQFPRGNPILDVERSRERAPVIRFLSPADVPVQLAALEAVPVLRAAVAVMILAGLRRGEILWLTAEDVDLQSGMLRIRAKRVAGAFWEPKTGTNRGVPISSALRGSLELYEAARDSSSSWYFPTSSGGRFDADNFSRALRVANRAAGLSWSALDYRHTFGSLLALKGVSLYKISALMGNSPEICRRHYAALHPEQLAADVEFL